MSVFLIIENTFYKLRVKSKENTQIILSINKIFDKLYNNNKLNITINPVLLSLLGHLLFMDKIFLENNNLDIIN